MLFINAVLIRGKKYRTFRRNMDEKERRTLLTDNWNGFANLLANLVEKYAAVLDIDNLPEPPICLDSSEKEHVNNSKHFSESIEKVDIA